MRKILVPTDFSETSYKAIEYAVQLFINEETTFYVVNTYTPVALYPTTIYDNHTAVNIDLGEIYKNNSAEGLHKMIGRVNTTYRNSLHTFESISSYNVLTVEVNELVKKLGIECVVMGTNGASGLADVFVGSETMHVIKNAEVPVIGVPTKYEYTSFKDILFATDYRAGANQVGFKFLENLCRKHIARIIFFNAYYGVPLDEEQLKNKEELDIYFERDAHINQVADGMDVLEAVEDFQSKHKVDLLVLVHNKHNFFANLFFTPVIRTIVHHATVPFMVLPPVKINS